MLNWVFKSASLPIALIAVVGLVLLESGVIRDIGTAAVLVPFTLVLSASLVLLLAQDGTSLKAFSFSVRVLAVATTFSIFLLYLTSVYRCISTPYYLRTRFSPLDSRSNAPCFHIDTIIDEPFFITEMIISGILFGILIIPIYRISVRWFAQESQLQKFDLLPIGPKEAIWGVVKATLLTLFATLTLYFIFIILLYASVY